MSRTSIRWLIGLGLALPSLAYAQEADDVADVPSSELQAGGKEKQRYFLIGPATDAKLPKEGYGLMVILPGGDGSADFHPFVKRIYKHAVPPGYLAVQLVAVRWTPDQQIVWPTAKDRAVKKDFTTEEFIESVVADVRTRHKIDARKVFTLSWSSSGPAAYAASFGEKTSVKGSFIAMSVFRPTMLDKTAVVKGRRYYLYHSPKDRTCPYVMAKKAADTLASGGAAVKLQNYNGAHGWNSPTLYKDIETGLRWLDRAAATQPASAPAK
jgi:predicted esterase